MKKRNWFFGALVAAGALFGSTAAQAAFLLDDWRFDASGVDGLPVDALYDTPGIDLWTFQAHFFQQIHNDNGNFLPDAGENGTVDGVGNITAMVSDETGVRPNPLLNLNPSPFPGFPGYEVTFKFSVDYLITAADATDANFVHTAPNFADGLLHIYVDNLGDGSSCVVGTGLGCEDGVEVATFRIIPGGGGAFVIATIDGSDDATFEAVFLADGVWFDKNGNSLACNDAVVGQECDGQVIGLTDSNIDSDDDGNGALDTTSSRFQACAPGVLQTPISSCGDEDGSLRLATVPEPASLAIFSAGLVMLGIGGAFRRRRAS
jgi:hypothetical protein